MAKFVFISHVFEDSQFIGNMKDWEKDPQFDYKIIAETQDIRNEGYEVIRERILKKIKNCSAVIVLIGNDSHNKTWIEVEVEWANSNKKKIVCARIPNSTGGIPDILKKCEVIDFEKKKVQKALKK